jgi:hypothetical protein
MKKQKKQDQEWMKLVEKYEIREGYSHTHVTPLITPTVRVIGFAFAILFFAVGLWIQGLLCVIIGLTAEIAVDGRIV